MNKYEYPTKVSVIIPVYNVEDYLERCVKSIQHQTLQNIQIILVNDGSSDTSGKICEAYKKKDKRIQVKHQANQGSSIARNRGLAIAEGEFIAFVDSDDWIAPEMLETMIDLAECHNLEIVECLALTSVELNRNNFKEVKPISSNHFHIETSEQALRRLIDNQNFAVWRRIYRREFLHGMTFIPEKIHQDVFFTLDVVKKASHIGYTNIPFYYYNVENESVIRSPYNKKKLDAIDAVYYVVESTKLNSREVRLSAEKHLVEALVYHYDSLFLNPALDPDFHHRSNIKQSISEYLNPQTTNFYAVVINSLPAQIYPLFLVLNKLRIRLKVALFKYFN